MPFFEAALLALFPVIIFFGITLWLRYLPALSSVDDVGMRSLIAGSLIITAMLVIENSFYGYARLDRASYATLSFTYPAVIAIKLGYVAGMCIQTYAFWRISPEKPKLIVPFFMAALCWFLFVVVLMIR